MNQRPSGYGGPNETERCVQTPFRKLDKVGLPLALHIMGMQPGADDPDSVSGKIVAMLKGYIDAGKTGIAVGEGFYRYDSEGNVVK